MLTTILRIVIRIIDQPALYCNSTSSTYWVKTNRWQAVPIIHSSLKISSLFSKGFSKGRASLLQMIKRIQWNIIIQIYANGQFLKTRITIVNRSLLSMKNTLQSKAFFDPALNSIYMDPKDIIDSFFSSFSKFLHNMNQTRKGSKNIHAKIIIEKIDENLWVPESHSSL